MPGKPTSFLVQSVCLFLFELDQAAIRAVGARVLAVLCEGWQADGQGLVYARQNADRARFLDGGGASLDLLDWCGIGQETAIVDLVVAGDDRGHRGVFDVGVGVSKGAQAPYVFGSHVVRGAVSLSLFVERKTNLACAWTCIHLFLLAFVELVEDACIEGSIRAHCRFL